MRICNLKPLNRSQRQNSIMYKSDWSCLLVLSLQWADLMLRLILLSAHLPVPSQLYYLYSRSPHNTILVPWHWEQCSYMHFGILGSCQGVGPIFAKNTEIPNFFIDKFDKQDGGSFPGRFHPLRTTENSSRLGESRFCKSDITLQVYQMNEDR